MAQAQRFDDGSRSAPSPGGTILLLRTDALDSLAEQAGRESIQILVPAEDTAIVTTYSTEAGQERRAFARAPLVSVIPPGQDCRMQATRTGQALVLRIAPEFYIERARAALGHAAALAPRYAAFDPFIRTLANTVLQELQGGTPATAYAEPIAALLTVHLARHYAAGGAAAAAAPAGLPPHRLARVQTLIREHIAEPLPVGRLAAEVGMSPYHFARMFKLAAGQPPHLYVVMQRVNRAKELLRDTDLPLQEISGRSGFRTQGHFSDVFRRYAGVTPRAFRLAARSEAARAA